LGAIQKLNEAVGDLDGVLGIEVSWTPCLVFEPELISQLMNEPHAGFIGLPTLQEWVSGMGPG
jgi:hypothetical protein